MEQRKRSMIGPLILITLGALLPLAKTGARPLTFWEIAARIRADQRIGSTKIDRTRFPKTGNEYQSADYATATNKIDINIDGGVGNISIQ